MSLEIRQSSTSSDSSGALLTPEHPTRPGHHPSRPGHQGTAGGGSTTAASSAWGTPTLQLSAPSSGARFAPVKGNSEHEPQQTPPNHPPDMPVSPHRGCLPHRITTSPREHFLCELLQAGSPSRSQDLQTLLHAKEHQHVLAGAVKLQENSTGSDTSCKLPSTGIDVLCCLRGGLELHPKLSQPGSCWDHRIGASK